MIYKFKLNNIDSAFNLATYTLTYGKKIKTLNKNIFFDDITDIYLKLSSNCNLKCIYCYQKYNAKYAYTIDLEKYENIFEYISSVSKKRIYLFGGEPFLFENLKNLQLIFNMLKDNKILVFTNSCQTSILNKFILKNKNIFEKLIVTIDGPEKIHNGRRIFEEQNSYKIILQNLSFYMKNGIDFIIQINIDNDNKNHIFKLIRELKFYFKDSYIQLKFTLNKVLHTSNTIEEIELIKLYVFLKIEYPEIEFFLNSILLKKLSLCFTNKGITPKRCGLANTKVFDFSTNIIHSCPQSVEFPIGAFNENLIEINQKFLKILENYNDKETENCSSCSFKNFCRFGCYLDKDLNYKNCKIKISEEIALILKNFDYFFKVK